MISEELLRKYPTKRIKPVDGMAVTEEVWEEAHEYHRLNQNFHALFSHGPGIVVGLDVIASDPPDTSVYILPGVAVDPAGQTIVLPQPVAYDVGRDLEGLLYILLSHGESRPRRGKGDRGDGPLYIHSEFSIFARTVLPDGPWVELARVDRESREAIFVDAADPLRPGQNEIDLRFRHELRAPQPASIAVCYLGQVQDKGYGLGAIYLGQALSRQGHYRVTVADNTPLAPGVEANTLIYLVGEGDFELNRGQMNGLRNYVERGRGSLLIENVDTAARSAFTKMLKSMGMNLAPIQAGHSLLLNPHLFATPPSGFEAEGAEVLVTDGVIFSPRSYGRLWQGKLQKGDPSREQIRSAIEWGENIIAYAAGRRRLVRR